MRSSGTGPQRGAEKEGARVGVSCHGGGVGGEQRVGSQREGAPGLRMTGRTDSVSSRHVSWQFFCK